jgi:Mrp family chromosome partitioning ATPase
MEMFKRAGAHVVGVVMNRVPRNCNYYYGSYKYFSPYINSIDNFSENTVDSLKK